MTVLHHASANSSAATTLSAGSAGDEADLEKEVTLLELLDRVLDKGVVLTGDITLSVADVDLVYVGLRVLLSSVESAQRSRAGSTTMPVTPEAAGPAI